MTRAEQKENSLLVAYEKAAEILRKSQPGAICERTGAVYENDSYRIRFMGREYEIGMPDVRFNSPEIPTIVEVLILHYLTAAGEKPVKGGVINFNGIPGGMFYFKTFQQRALFKLLDSFVEYPEKLIRAGEVLGGKKWKVGDYSSIIPVFPMIDMVVQIYTGDDEFPAEANILYSDNIVNFLPAEDAAFLGGYLAGMLAGVSG